MMKAKLFERRGLNSPAAILIAAALVIAAAAIAVSAQGNPPAQPPSPNQPKIQLIDPTYDFGSVMSGPAISHTFKVKNTGGGDLLIDRVQTSCGCTAAEPSRKHLKPGED